MDEALRASISDLLLKDLPTTNSGVRELINDCIKLTEPILRARITAQTKLIVKREQARHPAPEKGEPRLTDFDRQTMLEAAVSEYMADYELAKGLEALLGDRIQLLRSLL